MCGDCCDPVWYPFGPADIRQSAATTRAADLVFAAAHWHATGERDDDGRHAYRCDRFDRETRLCTAHDERPPICRGYPWYDDVHRGASDRAGPRQLVVLPARCAFREELEPPAR